MKGVEADYFTERKLFNNKINNETLISFKKNEELLLVKKFEIN